MVRGGLVVLNKNGMPESVIGTKKSYSTLKAMTKDELIELLGIAQHNYECSQNGIYNITKYAEKLDKALKYATSKLSGYGVCPFTSDDDHCCSPYLEEGIIDCKGCWTKYFDEIYLTGEE